VGLGALAVAIVVGGAFALNAMRTPEHISPRGTLAQSAPSDIPPAQAAENPTTAAPPQTTTLMVSSRDDPALGGTRTGINLQAGQLVTIQATGATTYGNEGAPCSGRPTVDPDGRRWNSGAACPQKFDTSTPVPTAPVGSLIGAVGSGPWYTVGGSASFRASTSGELRLGYNDAFVTDDTGSYTVSIVVQ